MTTPTRVYPITGTAPISPAVASGWENSVAGFTRYPASPSAADYTATVDAGSGSGVANEDTAAAQLVFGPIKAQSIGGTVKGQMGAREGSTAADARSQCTIRVIAPDGSTVRGTLLAMDTAALANEFVVDATTPRNIAVPRGGATALSTVQAFDGDYIVIEFGFRNHGTNTGGVRIRAPGGDASNGDLPENETTTPVTNYRGWFEFSQDIKLFVPSRVIMHDLGISIG